MGEDLLPHPKDPVAYFQMDNAIKLDQGNAIQTILKHLLENMELNPQHLKLIQVIAKSGGQYV